ncbi:polysaccharide deacetylase family protein [Micromonospora craterilacus]|uniref:Polysaccharide deacetylase family protein n=1 Tax=Micromonospora craterilacus TaxID=1655439 RepID=A0A2W2F3C9_9ACTN|nr:polysaccharide deacetylase family protein [Micromonospora craterilacus]PZG20290.1 polysaccharide deacetylase family protein [Micromonospora craterilacus]
MSGRRERVTRLCSHLHAQALHYLLFAYRGRQLLRRRPTLGGAHWPAFGLPGEEIALTVDDGPHPRWTPALLDLLDRHGVRATFFLVGDRVRERPDLARQVLAAGHLIGNHSMSHPQPFAALARHEIRAEIAYAQREIEDATAVTPRLFRAPGGNWSSAVLRITAGLGLSPVDWTVNPSDWRSPGVPQIVRTLSRTRPGQIMLCHDGGGDRSQTIAALAEVLPRLTDRGLRFVTVPDQR